MTQTLSAATPPVSSSHIVLYGISWEMYEQLLQVFAEQPTPRMTYYKGTLELMTPLPEHERYSWTLGRLVVVLSEELGLEIMGVKSTTWRSKPKAVGKEADECFYIQNEALVREKLKIDLTVDPPPDLAIEIDQSHSSIDKMNVYIELKVPEVWRWQNGKLTVNILTDAGYVDSETSLAFGSFPVKEFARFMQPEAQKGENARMREFREWVRSQLQNI
ncbi:Uma2 family endonuclease [Funiculus sociatus GB2-A5]|uniref:Uma2 family endonuclease n=1 Tax=Funiculus sociatus GB2-A5 TaxID=2933946 RepID=A0ABV0JRZ1_9CYAN|nr:MULTISPECIES: Uma2 family endonuclease [unclassified Trichocoleus]MBD1904326.1 Uma2 family endonuclease [Trichocoleus sp. FACHB-832]MBD2065023.1 Uma2 family endonuclease [Trichocoleus sp. FACHB-6]